MVEIEFKKLGGAGSNWWEWIKQFHPGHY